MGLNVVDRSSKGRSKLADGYKVFNEKTSADIKNKQDLIRRTQFNLLELD